MSVGCQAIAKPAKKLKRSLNMFDDREGGDKIEFIFNRNALEVLAIDLRIRETALSGLRQRRSVQTRTVLHSGR